MTDTSKYVTRMVLFLVAVAAGAAFIADTLLAIFLVNPFVNGVIFGVILTGIALNFRQVLMLGPEARWLETLRDTVTQTDTGMSELRADAVQPNLRLLAPMARMIGERRGRLLLSPAAMRTLLDGVGARLEESRDLARYFTGLCIFLGLLGTFWGLLETVQSIARVIRELQVTSEDLAVVFNGLKAGLESPLAGMGTAFSSSLFGLAGSLVLGFLDLQAAQAQNAFFNEMEEWLSGMTRVSGGATEGEQSISAYTEALLDQTAERLQDLVTIMNRSEQARAGANQQLTELNAKLAILGDQMRAEQQVLLRLAENQRELTPVIRNLGDAVSRLASADGSQAHSLDDATRSHIRNIDTLLGRIAGSLDSGRDDVVREIRGEIKLLARTLAALGGPAARDPDHAT
jgi:biopolymer transport protein ExbB/TolQ